MQMESVFIRNLLEMNLMEGGGVGIGLAGGLVWEKECVNDLEDVQRVPHVVRKHLPRVSQSPRNQGPLSQYTLHTW